MHFPNVLLPGPTRLRLTTLTTTTERIILDLTATQRAAYCPTCASETTHIHSHYQRTVADLPWASLPVQLHLHVRRFMCGNPQSSMWSRYHRCQEGRVSTPLSHHP